MTKKRCCPKKETPQERYQKKYRKDYKLAVLTHLDTDIIAKLESEDNKTGYLKKLIRDDIAKNGGTQACVYEK